MRYLKVVFLALFFVISILFFSQNNEVLSQALVLRLSVPYVTDLHSVPLPLYLLVLGGFLFGAVLTLLYLAADKIRAVKQLRECRTRMAGLEQELNSLRNMPITEEPYAPTTEPVGEEGEKS
mgnify:CR=1 FL=1